MRSLTAARAEIQANNAAAAQELVDIAKDSAGALATLAAETYGELSPRNQEIIDEAAKRIKELQANGASQAEMNKVFLTACRAIAGNVGETINEGIQEEIVKPIEEKLAENNLYFSADKAAIGFGKEANPATQGTDREKYGSIYSVGVGETNLYFNGVRLSGGHNNVIMELIGASTIGNALEKATLGIVQYEGFSHTHPYCTGHDNNNFSGVIGDQGAAILTGKAYLITPSGEVKYITREDAISAVFAGVDVNTKAHIVMPSGVDVSLDYAISSSKENCIGLTPWELFWGK